MVDLIVPIILSNMTQSEGYAILGVETGDCLGLSVSGAGADFISIDKTSLHNF